MKNATVPPIALGRPARPARAMPELAREGRERRHPRDRERAEQQRECGHARDVDRAAQVREPQRAVALADRARREEQGGLREGVIEQVERRGEERERAADPDGERDDAHVLDRRVRQEPLEIVLHEDERDRHEHRQRSDPDQQIGGEYEAHRARGEQVEPEHAVEGAGQQRAGEERADRRRSLAVGVRQPGVHRREARPSSRSRRGRARKPGA